MIPIKLKMRNFMCYRDVPPLSFEGIHTACISGDNGHGKSALIDAMTWALWGKTRAKSDDDLIHQGQTEMEVEFDFAVGQQRYRIIRKRAKPKRRQASGQSSLDLLIASGDGFRPISGDTVLQTQRKIIIDILHMDYDTFINTSYLRQGHADQFTRQPPAKRKEVLANILRLSDYDELAEQAKELAKEQAAEKAQLDGVIKDIDEKLAEKPAYQAELEQTQSELTNIEKIIREKESKLSHLRQQRDLLENKKVQLAQLETHIREGESDLKHWDEQVEQHHLRLKEYEELVARRATIEEGYTRFIEAKKLCDEFNQKLGVLLKLRERQSQLKEAISRAQAVLLQDHALAQSRITELEAKSQKLPQYKYELQQMQLQWRHLAELEEVLRGKRQIKENLQTRGYYLESHKSQLEEQIKEIEEKLNLLLVPSGAKCPLCETELGIEGLKLIETKYSAERQSKVDSLKSSQAELTQRKKELESLEGEILKLEVELNQGKASAQSKASLLSQAISEAEEAGRRLSEEKEGLAEIEQRLALKDFANVEQRVLDQVETELTRLNYDAQQHEQMRQRLASLEQYEAPRRWLEEADRLIDQERKAVSEAEGRVQELRQRLELHNQKRQELTLEITLLPQLISELTQAESEHQALAAQQRQAQERVGIAKEKLRRCSELEIQRKEKGKLFGEISKEEQIYRELAEAFGKKGLQAMLIDSARPEIEAEANKLLGRMTDNRMHVKIETQEETKKGDIIETLNINIADDLGTRAYEMFSGGEAFRINFAIRIALSRLLARRAGAPLRTLIVDEGFGTQDSTGIEKIKEAINSIQDDFDRILVITHIEEIRDAFSTCIDVIKTAEGSTVLFS